MIGARVGARPIHPLLVVVPLGLCIVSVIADLFRLTGLGGPAWFDVASYGIAGGVLGALIAALRGFIDYVSIRDARIRDIAFAHFVTALFVVAIYGLSLWMRWSGDQGLLPVAVSGVGLVLLCLVGWLGGEMVHVDGVGLTDEQVAAAGAARRKVA
ncbi:MAG TPA: DUF2231 domain-containing protein [Methylomirabilota bacterium]|nr:DUF2231 domain-containing protein [Methylomirabilota bacterium]